MRVRSLGHHGLTIATDAGTTIAINPWLSMAGAYAGAWMPFPDNAAMAENFATPDAIVVTSAGGEHLDAALIAALPANVPVIAAQSSIGRVRAKLAAIGRQHIIECAPWQPVTIGPDGVRIFLLPEPGFTEAAGVLILADGQSFLDINNARLPALFARTARVMAGGHPDFVTVDVTASGFTSASLEEPDAEKWEKAARREWRQRLEYCVQALRMLQAKAIAPLAGSPCLLAPDIADSAVRDAFLAAHLVLSPADVFKMLGERMIRGLVEFQVGDTFDVGAGTRIAANPPIISGDPWADRAAYVTPVRERRLPAIENELAKFPAPTASIGDAFRDYATELIAANPAFQRQINLAVGVVIDGAGAHGREWTLDFRPETAGIAAGLSVDVKFRLRLDGRWVAAVLDGRLDWADVLDSLRPRIWRDSTVRKDHFLTLLRAAHRGPATATEAMKTVLKAGELVTIPTPDGPMQIERYCPHAQLDLLETGEIVDGEFLRCIAHAYEFSLGDGRCLNATCRPLEVRDAAE